MAGTQAGTGVKNARQTPDITSQNTKFIQAVGVDYLWVKQTTLPIRAIWQAERGTAAEVTR